MSLASPVSFAFDAIFKLRRLLFDSPYFLSSDESYLLDDESDEVGYDFKSFGTYFFCNFTLCFDNSFDSVCVLWSDVFAPTGADLKRDIFASGISVPTGVDYKYG